MTKKKAKFKVGDYVISKDDNRISRIQAIIPDKKLEIFHLETSGYGWSSHTVLQSDVKKLDPMKAARWFEFHLHNLSKEALRVEENAKELQKSYIKANTRIARLKWLVNNLIDQLMGNGKQTNK